MNRTIFAIALILSLLSTDCFARGSFSSAGRGSFSSRSYSRSYSAPRSYSRSYSYSPRTTTVITRQSYGGGYGYGYHPYYHSMMYPGFGMGYGYSNGLMQGLIIGDLMHPQGTTVYTGGGYQGNALLYPNGMVVDPNGYQVGTYANGQFSAMQGGMVAQPAPVMPQAEAYGPPAPWSAWEIIGTAIIGVLIIFIILAALVT